MSPTAPTDRPATASPAARPRLFHLDVIRGIAMLGILPVNMLFWALPGSAFTWMGGTDTDPLSEIVAFAVTGILFREKFISIFAFLFGAGMTLLLESCERGPRSYPTTMVRRLGTLWILGILHATLLWSGDIVSIYAPMGLALCWLVWLDRRVLVTIGIVAVLLPVAPIALFALAEAASGPMTQGGVESFDPHAPLGEFFLSCLNTSAHQDPYFETAIYRNGSFARICLIRIGAWLHTIIITLVFYGFRLAGLFALGMGLMKAAAFRSPASARGRLMRIALVAAVVGIPLQAVAMYLELHEAYGWWTAELPAYLGSAALATAYVAGLSVVSFTGVGSKLLRPFAAVGRTAFSNYVLQSVCCNALFYSYGLRLYGELTRAELWLATGGIWVVEILLSVLWMRWFSMGPLEWIWRGLTYGKLSPLLRRPASR